MQPNKQILRKKKNLKVELPYDPTTLLLSVYLGKKKNENTTLKRWNTSVFIAALLDNSQGMESTQVSINRWTDEEGVLHIYNRVVLSHKKVWNSAICGNMDEPIEHYA